jgi:TonB family protein
MKKILSILSLTIFTATALVAQDTMFYKNSEKSVRADADSYQILVKDVADTNKVTEKYFYISGNPKSETTYSNYKEKTIEGITRSWWENGKRKREVEYQNGKYHGKFRSWWENGNLKREDVYENGEIKSGLCYDENGNQIPFYKYEIMPQFPGGEAKMMLFIRDSVQYPTEAKENNIQGTCYVTFVVEKDGKLTDIKMLRGSHPILDAEAMRVVGLMPTWLPGKQDGMAVRVQFNLPIKFTLWNPPPKRRR